jgi:hypothetical protein
MFRSILSKLSSAILVYFIFVSAALAAITDGKFGINQIFDVQYYWSGTTLHASNFIAPYNKNFQTVTVTAGQYFQFFESTTNPGKYGLKLMNSNGTQHSIVHDHGDITALGSGAIFYIGSGFFGNVISTAQGYNYGASASFTNMDTSVSSADLNNYTFASSTPLAAGQTAGPPPPVPTAIYNNSSNVYITNHYPTSNNSPAGEGATQAFDNNPNTKYLNFDKQNAGVTIKLNAGRVVNEFTLTTANDFSGRDPTSYKLYASNDGVNWTLIQEGPLSLSNDRFWTSPKIPVTNTTAYVYYYIFFPTTKSGEGCGLNCDSMQIAEITFYYDSNNTTTSTATGTGSVTNPGSVPTPVYSSGINPTQAMRRSANLAQTTGNNANVSIVGNNNSVEVEQIGGGHYASVDIDGNSNSINTLQTTATSSRHYLEATVDGNSNTLLLQQRDTNKNMFVSIYGDYINLTVNQKGLGNHYLEMNMIGDDHVASIIQDGSGNHAATIQLENGGGAWNFQLSQDGSTNQTYSLPHGLSNGNTVSGVCSTPSGCNLTVVQQ